MKKSFLLNEPNVLLTPSFQACIRNLKDASVNYTKINGNYLVFDGKPFDDAIELRIGLQHAFSRITFIEIFRPESYFQNDYSIDRSYEELQNAIIARFGQPTMSENRNLAESGFGPSSTWLTGIIRIEHYIIDRFGPEEHMYITFFAPKVQPLRAPVKHLEMKISFIGGFFFGIIFFFIFGAVSGYTLWLFLLCQLGGLFWGFFFYLFMFRLNNRKPVNYYTARNEEKIKQYEDTLEESYAMQFVGLINMATGNQSNISQVNIDFFPNYLLFVTVYRRGIRFIQKRYDEIEKVQMNRDWLNVVIAKNDELLIRLKNETDASKIIDAFTEYKNRQLMLS